VVTQSGRRLRGLPDLFARPACLRAS
jgi:hypothetical protein